MDFCEITYRGSFIELCLGKSNALKEYKNDRRSTYVNYIFLFETNSVLCAVLAEAGETVERRTWSMKNCNVDLLLF